MSDNKILNYSFASAGKNKYYASEVDEYLRSISESYDSMYKSYKALDKKMKALAPAIEEYKSNKNIIVSSIVRAEKYYEDVKAQANESSAEIIRKASEEAENLLLTKKAEAEAYHYNLTHDADEKLKQLETDIENLENHALELQEKYLAQTKEKAAEIIDNAKTKAAEIVAAAYQDAKTARQQSDEIITATNAELQRLKAEIAKYKNEIFSVVATIKPAVDSITADAEFDFAPTEVEVDTDSLTGEMPEFSLDMEFEKPVSEPEEDLYEDISSFTDPELAFAQPEGIPFTEEVYAEDKTTAIPDLSSGIFSDDENDDSVVDFAYHSDFDSLFEGTDN
ncbi:MAG: DivIVA domain-containing protein [Clostridia bacterium]|nr:DivIVA domain-containing protein [Clostridia bacterium]